MKNKSAFSLVRRIADPAFRTVSNLAADRIESEKKGGIDPGSQRFDRIFDATNARETRSSRLTDDLSAKIEADAASIGLSR